MYILGVFGPWQIMVMLCLLAAPVVIVFVLINSRAKHKAKAETLDAIVKDVNTKKNKPAANKDTIDQLEKLNKLRESGALTQEEFDAQKAKLL